MTNLLAALIICHLVGDFLLQNHWMQTKSKDSFVCFIHVLCYSLPFWIVGYVAGVHYWVVLFILVEHYFQDRYALHLKWMELYGQTTPDKWPVGPLCMDQSMHLAFIGTVFYFFI